MGAAVMVDVTLGEGSAEPAEQGTAAGVGCERRPALAAWSGQAEELGVERVGKVLAECGRVGDGDCGLGERRAIETEEALPCRFAAEGAGLGEGEVGQAQRPIEGGLLRGRGARVRRQVVVILLAGGS